MRTALTVFFIPYMALGAELSNDYNERTSVTTYRTTMGWVVALLMYWGVMRFIFGPVDGVDGRLIEESYWTMAIWSFILVVVFSVVSIFFTRKRIPFLPTSTHEEKSFGLVRTVVDLWNALRNHNFRVVFLVMISSSMILGVLPSVGMHLGTFFWELTTKQMADVGLLMIIANLSVFAVMDPVSKRIEKHHLLQLAFIGYGINLAWFIGFRLLGLLPENGHWMILALFFINQFIQTVCMMIIHIIPASIIADIADEHAYNTGQRQEGVFFAAQGFSAKAISGFGTLFGGWVLDFVGMPGNVHPQVHFHTDGHIWVFPIQN